MTQASLAEVADVPVVEGRQPLDAYYTPQALADAIVGWVADDFFFGEGPSVVLEPSVGSGSFVRAVWKRWPAAEIHGIDLNSLAAGLGMRDLAYRPPLCVKAYVGDFASIQLSTTPTLTIGNPPFSCAESHARRAIEVTPGGVVALLLRSAFFHGAKRGAFWERYPARKEYRLVERPSFTGGGTDSAEYSVFVWTPGRELRDDMRSVRRSWK